MFEIYFPILVLVALVTATAVAFFLMSILFGKKTKSAIKEAPYESGMVPTGDTKERFSVKFYLVAILFIIFDLEVVFLYPWAVVYNTWVTDPKWADFALFGLVEMGIFVVILLVGYFYILRAGALKWD